MGDAFIETEITELKASTGELHEAVESIASILNKHGKGTLYFGILDDGTIKGQIVSDSTIKGVTDAILRNIEPRITPTVEQVTLHGKSVIKVTFSGKEQPYSAFGRFLIRVGTQNRQMTRSELERLIKTSDYSSSWEKEEANISFDDLDLDAMRNYWREAVSAGRLRMDEFDPHLLLATLGLERDGKYLNSANVLFGKNPLVEAKCACYVDDEKLSVRNLSLQKGNVYNLIRFCLTYILNHINWKIEIGLKEHPEIPERAIFEIIVNAFAHASYNSFPQIDIDIHPNMVTISNPGSFPDWLQPSDFVSKNIPSMKRNPLILETLYRCEAAEKAGTGFKNMDELCNESGVKWKAEKSASGFSFTFLRNGKGISNLALSGLTPNERAVYALIKGNTRITREEIAKSIGRTVRTVQRITNSLVDKGYILRVGNNQFGYWEIAFKDGDK